MRAIVWLPLSLVLLASACAEGRSRPVIAPALVRYAPEVQARAAEELGLENGAAREDLRELRSLLGTLRLAKRTAWQTTVRIVTTAFVVALLTWAGIKLKLFGS